jgi:threonine dehydrogenase-like Zn-dependent dehydrogenase
MRAAVLTGPRRAEVVATPVPEPGEGQVVVALEGCGVCGSNAPVWEGRPWFDYPLAPGAPGHEGWGRLEDGTRVALLGEDAFAERAVVPADHVVPIPAAVGDDPFPGEALGCGFNVAARSDFRPGQTVAVIGAGFLGAVVIAAAARAGARVVAVSRRDFSLGVARSMGAHHTIRMDDHQRIIDEVADLTDGRLCDRVVEAVGLQWPVDLAGELTAERGRLVIAGFHQDGLRSVNLQLWNWRGIDVVNAHERDPQVRLGGIRAAADAVADGWFDPSPLYTHRFPLDRLGDAMDALVDKPDGFLKAVVTL